MNNNGWTEERRIKQAEAIKNWQPWQHSTGAKTKEGKETSKMNAFKHGAYAKRFYALQSIINL